MNPIRKPLAITELVLRDGHQSLLATRMRLDDMLPIASQLDDIGYWSMESWGGATFDACIRFLGEDPWERIRAIKTAMPKTPQQMLLRGQNVLGYRHYADDVVHRFVERAAINGVDVFRVFDAMNDARNMKTALEAVKSTEKHAQGTLSYTVSPVHDINSWLDLAKELEDMGSDSLCIKDMAGLLTPYAGYELVKRLKQIVNLDIHVHCHATTGLSTATYLKCIEAGADNVNTSISSMSLTYGHSATETLVAILKETDQDTQLSLEKLEEISQYFRKIRRKYAKFEGSLKGIDPRILVAQVPGGMLTNMENQLKEQGASERFNEVLQEIPRVRKDLGYIPLVTPTSQIVGTQAVLNVLTGERYRNISKETQGVLRGEYGRTPAKPDSDLQNRALNGDPLMTCRPANLLSPEMTNLTQDLLHKSQVESFEVTKGERQVDDVLIYALFPQVGLKYLKNRHNPDAFEPAPTEEEKTNQEPKEGIYTVEVENKSYTVSINQGGDIDGIVPIETPAQNNSTNTGTTPSTNTESFPAPLAGVVFNIMVAPGQRVKEGEPVLILEAMKMETTVSAPRDCVITSIPIQNGDIIAVGDTLLVIS